MASAANTRRHCDPDLPMVPAADPAPGSGRPPSCPPGTGAFSQFHAGDWRLRHEPLFAPGQLLGEALALAGTGALCAALFALAWIATP